MHFRITEFALLVPCEIVTFEIIQLYISVITRTSG